VVSPLGYAKIELPVHVILTYHCLKSQINVGIRMQKVDKTFGGQMAGETIVRRWGDKLTQFD